MYYKSFLSVVAGAAFALCLAGCGKEDDVQPDAKVALTSINVTPAQVLLTVGGTQQLTPAAVPADASEVNFKWTSASTAVATVSANGLVTAVALGATTVTVTSGSVKKDVPVTVSDKPLTAFTVAPTEINASLGDEAVQLTITRTPADGVGAFTYASGNDAVATVSADGLVTIVGAGTTTITVTSGDLEPQTVAVTVSSKPLTSFIVTPTEINARANSAPVQLEIIRTPADGVGAFTYASGNEEVATVSAGGLVTFTGVGTTVITVTSGTLEPRTVPVTVLEAVTDDLNRSEWTITATSEWNEGSKAELMLDGDVNTFWHTATDLTWPTPGVSFTVDMKELKNIEGFYLIHRLDGDCHPKSLTIETSADGEDWTPVYETSTLETTHAGKHIQMPLESATVARYFRVTISETVNGASYTYLAEISIYNESNPYTAGVEQGVSTNAVDVEDFGANAPYTVFTATAGSLKGALGGITTPGNYVLNITGDATLDALESGTNITLTTPGVTISLRGDGSNTISPANDAGIVKIMEGKLILRNLTLSKTGHRMPTVWVDANGELVIHEGVSITGTGESTNTGVYVSGRFVMKGGEIHGHSRLAGGGGAMYLYNAGVFQMDGGKIYDNRASYGGGILIMNGTPRFIMNGGEFYDNHSIGADEAAGAVYLYLNGRVEINTGATIYGKDGGDGKAGNTGTNGDVYGHAVTTFVTTSSGKKRSNTIQGETLSITVAGGAETASAGNWENW
jgi:hypothetical protein